MPNPPTKLSGKEFHPLSSTERIEMYEHVLYELASAFCPPNHENDSELRESVYLRVMISIRTLTYFFTFEEARSYFRDDVFAWQFFSSSVAANFKGETRAPRIPRDDLDKINKQIAHLCRGRVSFKGASKRWRVELRDELKPIAMQFIAELFNCHRQEIPRALVPIFRSLYRDLDYRESHTIPTQNPASNTAYEVISYGDPNVTHCEPIAITDLLAQAAE